MVDPGSVSSPPGGSLGPIPSLSPTARAWHKPVFIVFLLVWAVNAAVTGLRVEVATGWGWLEALLPVTGAATTLLALAGRLPLQNVLMAGVWIASLSLVILSVGALTATPFGPFVYTPALGERILGLVPWPLPLLWVMLVINARGVARLILRPWRKTNYYGFWVIGVACVLMVFFALNFEPFATRVRDFWYFESGRSARGWFSAPWVCFLGWFLTALTLLCLSIPWLINKHPVKTGVDYQPLVMWGLLTLWPAIGNLAHGLWAPAAVGLAGCAAAVLWAVRGARW